MSRLVVVYDACVLYPAPLRDTLMHIGLSDLCQPRWTEQIHQEWIYNLLTNRADLTREQLERVRSRMNAAIPDSIITGYETLIEGLTLPDPNDRHVLAAAIHAQAQLIVTNNLRDFPSKSLSIFGIEARSADMFLAWLFEESPDEVIAALRKQRQGLTRPPKTADEFIDTIKQQGLTALARYLQSHIVSL